MLLDDDDDGDVGLNRLGCRADVDASEREKLLLNVHESTQAY